MRHRIIHRVLWVGLLLGVVLGLQVRFALAQPVLDTLITAEQLQELAAFEEATALAVDPAGWLYVTDAGADAAVQLASDGTVQARYGGSGTRPGTFDNPADLAPTNGLALYVADAGNARVQRFARAFQFLEALPVGRDPTAPTGPTYDSQNMNAFARGTGEPVSIAVSDADDLYVIDAARGHVEQWAVPRTAPQVIGGFDAGPGALRDPVGLALGPNERLYVADRGRNAIVVFDAFGRFLTTLADGRVADATALRFVDGQLWLVGPRTVQEVDSTGRIGRRWVVRLDAPLVDATRRAGRTYLLTSQRLYRWARP